MPTLHLICGLPGAGKTTLARQLESDTHSIRLCPDEWIAALVTTAADRAELDRLRAPVEELQWTHAQDLLRRGVSVILENGFWSRDERIEYGNAGRLLGVKVVLHFLEVSRDEAWQRIRLRNEDLPNGGFRITRDELEGWFDSFTPPDEGEGGSYDGFEVYRTGDT